MADAKITALPVAATVAPTDLIAIVKDPAGTPETQRATVAALGAAIGGDTAQIYLTAIAFGA